MNVDEIDVACRVEHIGATSRLNSSGRSEVDEGLTVGDGEMVFLKLTVRLPRTISASDAARFIADTSQRTLWDQDVESYAVHRTLKDAEHDDVVRMVRTLGGGQLPVELVLLRSIRNDDVNGTYLLAYVAYSLRSTEASSSTIDRYPK